MFLPPLLLSLAAVNDSRSFLSSSSLKRPTRSVGVSSSIALWFSSRGDDGSIIHRTRNQRDHGNGTLADVLVDTH